jgi:hypothetical protein
MPAHIPCNLLAYACFRSVPVKHLLVVGAKVWVHLFQCNACCLQRSASGPFCPICILAYFLCTDMSTNDVDDVCFTELVVKELAM